MHKPDSIPVLILGGVAVAGAIYWALRSGAHRVAPGEGPDEEFRVLPVEERYEWWAKGIRGRIANLKETQESLSKCKEELSGPQKKSLLELEEMTTKCLIEVDSRDVHGLDELRSTRRELVAMLTSLAEGTASLTQ